MNPFLPFFICILSCFIYSQLMGQNLVDQAQEWKLQLPSCDSFVEIVSQNSSYLKSLEESNEMQLAIYQSQKLEWLKAFSVSASYLVGGSSGIILNEKSGGQIIQNNGVQVGLQLNVPLGYEIFGRKKRNAVYYHQFQKEQLANEQAQIVFKQDLVQQYFVLVELDALVQIQMKRYQDAFTAFQVVKLNFENGEVPFEQLSLQEQVMHKNQTDLISSLYRLQTAIHQLEYLLGFPISNFIRS